MSSQDAPAPEDDFVHVEIESVERRHNGFLSIDQYRVRVPRFDGTSSSIERDLLERGASVCMLPYDPTTDRMLLIRQFLIGSFVAGRAPRPLQVVAGMVDDAETDEAAARREALEKAGCEIQRMMKAQAFLPTPGGSSECASVKPTSAKPAGSTVLRARTKTFVSRSSVQGPPSRCLMRAGSSRGQRWWYCLGLPGTESGFGSVGCPNALPEQQTPAAAHHEIYMAKRPKASKPGASKEGARPPKAAKRAKNQAGNKTKQPSSSSLLKAERLAIDRTKDALKAGPEKKPNATTDALVILTSQMLREFASKEKLAGRHAEAEKHERAARAMEIRGPRGWEF